MIKEKLTHRDFGYLKNKGQKLKGRYFIFLYAPVEISPGAGFIVSKRHGKAVSRNLQKRWIRSMYKQEKETFYELFNNVRLLVIALPFVGTYEQKQQDFYLCLKKLERKLQDSSLC